MKFPVALYSNAIFLLQVSNSDSLMGVGKYCLKNFSISCLNMNYSIKTAPSAQMGKKEVRKHENTSD